jgi:hypothetical protein
MPPLTLDSPQPGQPANRRILNRASPRIRLHVQMNGQTFREHAVCQSLTAQIFMDGMFSESSSIGSFAGKHNKSFSDSSPGSVASPSPQAATRAGRRSCCRGVGT